MQYFEARSDNQGQKSLDRLSLFSFIHPFTVLTLILCLFSSGIVTPNPCIQMQFPLPTPCFNVALNSGVRASTIWINIENGERGKVLVIMPQWSNTFGPDCRFITFELLIFVLSPGAIMIKQSRYFVSGCP